jgi:hypothetical protein
MIETMTDEERENRVVILSELGSIPTASVPISITVDP